MGSLSGTTLEELINSISVGDVLALLGTPHTGTIAGDLHELDDHLVSQNAVLGSIAGQTSLLPGIESDVQAMQTSVDTMDSKLDGIKSDTDDIPTTLETVGRIETKVDNLEICCADVGTAIAAIPTNPVLTTDPRLDNLDVPVSTRATPADCGGSGGGVFVAPFDLVGFIEEGDSVIIGSIDDESTDIIGTMEYRADGELIGLLDEE